MMKKLPHKFKAPMTMFIVMPTMMLGMPAIMVYQNLPAGEPFIEIWLRTVGQITPTALILATIVTSLATLFVSKVLLESKDS